MLEFFFFFLRKSREPRAGGLFDKGTSPEGVSQQTTRPYFESEEQPAAAFAVRSVHSVSTRLPRPARLSRYFTTALRIDLLDIAVVFSIIILHC